MKQLLLTLVICQLFLLVIADFEPSLEPFSPTSPPISPPLDIATILRDLFQWEHYIEEIITNTSKATIFIPIGNQVQMISSQLLDPSTVFYHVVPDAFCFHKLKQFENGTRFPTLVHSKSILITNNDGSNFTIDGVRITWPDLYYNGGIAIHGLAALLDRNVYGGDANVPMPALPSPHADHHGILLTSDASRLAGKFLITILALCMFMVF